MWSFDIRADTRFFALAACLLYYLEVSVIELIIAVRDSAHYLTAERRLTVNTQDARGAVTGMFFC